MGTTQEKSVRIDTAQKNRQALSAQRLNDVYRSIGCPPVTP